MLKRAAHLAALIFVLIFARGTAFAQASGADTFKAKCEMCHGADGLGATQMGKALGVASYKAPEALKLKDADLTAIIKNGKNSKMPPSVTNSRMRRSKTW